MASKAGRRPLVLWAALIVGLAALTGAGAPPIAVAHLPVVVALMTMLSAVGVVVSRRIAKARAGAVVVDTQAPPWRLWTPAWMAGLLAGAGVFTGAQLLGDAAMTQAAHPTRVLFGAGMVGLVVGAMVPSPAAARADVRGVWWWLIVDGALPAAVVSAGLGGLVGAVHLGIDVDVGPSRASRVLAGTILLMALLGVGGFARGFAEVKGGLVRPAVGPPPWTSSLPPPAAVALIIAVVAVVLGPEVLPTLSSTSLVLAKVLLGAGLGGALSLLGALRGWQAAAGVPETT